MITGRRGEGLRQRENVIDNTPLTTPGRFQVLIYVKSWVNLRAIVRMD
jgi:hypothetical protein